MSHNDESAKSRRKSVERLACTVAFTAVQLWAAVVIVFTADLGGVLALAVALVLAAALMSVHDAWREVRSARRGPEVGVVEELVRT